MRIAEIVPIVAPWALCGCALGGSAVEIPIVIEPMSATDERVGPSCVDLGDWKAAGAGRSVETTISIRGEECSLVLEWPADAEFPIELLFLPRESGASQVVSLTWRTVIPLELATARASLGSAELLLHCKGRDISGKWYERARHVARFHDGGVEQEAWFVDGDLDGRLDGAGDRWIAGPAARLGRLELHNPYQEMRPLSEPWCMGPRRLSVPAGDGPPRAIRSERSSGDSELLARHYERVQEESTRAFPARSLMLEKQGDDPDRPAAESPMAWSFANDLADARRIAAELRKPLLVEVTSLSCGWCRILSYVTHPDSEVDAALRQFACVRVIAELDPERSWEPLGIEGFPCTARIGADGELIGKIEGFEPPSRYVATLRRWLDTAGETAPPRLAGE